MVHRGMNMVLRMKELMKSVVFLLPFMGAVVVYGQERTEPIAYGDMDKWMVREVEESFVIGGNTKYLYEVASGDTLFDNTPYVNGVSPWGTSSVMARVSGVVKTSLTVFPEKRGDGYCARLETRMEHCKVLGLFNIRVVASGTIFLGQMVEPITDTKNPQSKMISGIPFTERPKALIYDYKVITGGPCTYASGFGRPEPRDKQDMAVTFLLLQHRWEDGDGNVYARRVATAWKNYGASQTEWQNDYRLPLHYGDITSESFYQSEMGLVKAENAYYTRNSKGKMVPIQEVGWAGSDEKVTHIILQFSSSNGGAYIGNTDSRLWVDNVRLAY